MASSFGNELLRLGACDILQFFEVVSEAQEYFGIKDATYLYDVIQDELTSLLAERLILMGYLGVGAGMLIVVPWPGCVETVVERAISEWKALNRTPSWDDICWLGLTAKGHLAALEIIWHPF